MLERCVLVILILEKTDNRRTDILQMSSSLDTNLSSKRERAPRTAALARFIHTGRPTLAQTAHSSRPEPQDSNIRNRLAKIESTDYRKYDFTGN